MLALVYSYRSSATCASLERRYTHCLRSDASRLGLSFICPLAVGVSSALFKRRGTQTLAVWPGLAKGQDAEGECAVRPCCENFCWQCRLVQVGEFFVVRPSLRWTGSWLLISVVLFAHRANTMFECTQAALPFLRCEVTQPKFVGTWHELA